ncbi:MAG: polyprenyl synthetase family protein [Anaerolineae bacterium]|nr:polyprenyl synthetase family protein [Anaerolineae bacterium]
MVACKFVLDPDDPFQRKDPSLRGTGSRQDELEFNMITGQEWAWVDTALQEAVASDVEILCKASMHILRAGGKRLRPKIVLLSYKAVGGNDVTRAVPLAVAVELLHTASLIHDDINDHSDMRRGRETINTRWGNGLALLVGDFVFVKSLNLISTFDPHVIQVLANCCTAIVEGETSQMLHVGDTRMTEEEYLAILSQKTASLMSACGELGGIVAGGTERQISALKAYGLNLGIAFQIRDDTLDLVGDRDELGKPTSNDLDQGKMSLAALFAIRESEKKGGCLSLKDLQRSPNILDDTGAIEYAMLKASEYADMARKALVVLPESEAKVELCGLADFAVTRNR